MKRKTLALMLSLTLALSMTACGGSDSSDAADTETAVEAEEETEEVAEEETADEAEETADAAEEADEANEDLGPLYSIPAIEAPEVAGTTWAFVGAMLDGEELDEETCNGVLEQNYGGTLEMAFDEDGGAQMIQGGGTLEGTYSYVDESTILVVLDNNGSELQYACAFADVDGVTMVLMNDDTGYNGLYFMQE